MLTSGELAFLTPVFGFLGVVTGAWVASMGARSQRKFEATRERYDRRVEAYENLIVLMSDSTVSLEQRLRGEEPRERDEQTRRTESIMSARAALISSKEVRDAYGNWAQLYAKRAVAQPAAKDEHEAAKLKAEAVSAMANAALKVTQAMAADLDALSVLPSHSKP